MLLPQDKVNRIIDAALEEDVGQGDITTAVLIPAEITGSAHIRAKANGVLAGVAVAGAVFLRVDSSLQFRAIRDDGAPLAPGQEIAVIIGSTASIMKAERTALNFLQRMSGIASVTARYVAAVAGLPVHILDTRKTVPGLRILDKYAVKTGGGDNHRFHLGDAILIKDNHLAVLRARGMNLVEIVAQAKRGAGPAVRIEVETQNVADALVAAKAGANIVMLDNMTCDEMRYVVEKVGDLVLLEASGGVNLETVRTIAETGVDYISVGALTHSVSALDISLDMD